MLKRRNNKSLYESIMRDVSKIIKKHLNENTVDEFEFGELLTKDILLKQIPNYILKSSAMPICITIEDDIDINDIIDDITLSIENNQRINKKYDDVTIEEYNRRNIYDYLDLPENTKHIVFADDSTLKNPNDVNIFLGLVLDNKVGDEFTNCENFGIMLIHKSNYNKFNKTIAHRFTKFYLK